MALVTTRRCRISGALPARFVKKRKTKHLHYGKSRIGHMALMHIEPEQKVTQILLLLLLLVYSTLRSNQKYLHNLYLLSLYCIFNC